MKIAALTYSYPRHMSANLGDAIQTLAVIQHLPRVDFFIDRDELDKYEGEECVVVLNGWFSHRPAAWPPSNRILPIFYGFHMTSDTAHCYARYVDYFRRFQPIGCRDRGTLNIVRSWGLEAYLSLCLTLTFPTRDKSPDKEYIALVNVSKAFLNRRFRKQCVKVSHSIAPIAPQAQIELAKAMLEFYRDQASHVITSRIHAAMPCLAMGIPVLYIGRINRRTSILYDAGVPGAYIWNKKSLLTPFRKFRITTDSFYIPQIDQVKADIIGRFRERLAAYGLQKT